MPEVEELEARIANLESGLANMRALLYSYSVTLTDLQIKELSHG